MKQFAISMVLFALAVSAQAQSPEASYRAHGYFTFGAGRCSKVPCGTVKTLNGGGEVFVYRGLAGGVEGGYGWAQDALSAGAGILSIGPSYHFKGQGRLRRVVPFVTGGYTMLARQMSVNGSHWGGGVTVWPANHFGLRFEGRLYHFNLVGMGVNIAAARVGIALR